MEPFTVPTLTTERLVLRLVTEEDLPELEEIFTDPVAMQHMFKTYTRQEVRELWLEGILNRYREHGHSFMAVERRRDGAFLGICGLLRQEVDGELLIEIGYHFQRKHWGHGYATEAATTLRDYAFDTLSLPTLVSLIVPENTPSIAVAERNGMKHWKTTTFKGLTVRVYRILPGDPRPDLDCN